MRIELTAIDTVLTKEAEEKLDNHEIEGSLDYESLGISPPKEEELILGEEDYEEIYAKCEMDTNNFTVVVENSDKGSTIYLRDAIKVTVKETIEEINSKRKNFFQRMFDL